MTKRKFTQTDKFIIHLKRSTGFWPCVFCSTAVEVSWHGSEWKSCPLTGKGRDEAEDKAEALK